VLEVIETNAPAAALYRALGFVERRRLQVWTYAAPAGAPDAGSDAAAGAAADIPELAAPDLDAITADADVELPWQNSIASLRRAVDPYVALGDDRGAAIIFPGSGDLPLLCVRRATRRRGHGTRLLAAAAARAGRPIRTMVDDADAGIAAFLEAAGAARLVRQLEMVRALGPE
jgi:ribosomal protein S18 acetylase RimI-like enzyme